MNAPHKAPNSGWWRSGVIYQIYPRSYQDSNGDGIGDLPGITRRLDHIARLGADAVWLSPIFTSPMKDFGYDVSDYNDIDPMFGTLADFRALVDRAHALGLKVIIDQVLSHSSEAGVGRDPRDPLIVNDGTLEVAGTLAFDGGLSTFNAGSRFAGAGPVTPRQILRHRSFSFQEFSQRYAAVVAAPVLRETRLQDAKNRQASIAADDEALHEWWQNAQAGAATDAHSVYVEALRRGIAKEVARAVLPEGMTESVLYMAGTIRSWIHYCLLRSEPGTQKEHRDVALACRAVLVQQFPALAEVLP